MSLPAFSPLALGSIPSNLSFFGLEEITGTIAANNIKSLNARIQHLIDKLFLDQSISDEEIQHAKNFAPEILEMISNNDKDFDACDIILTVGLIIKSIAVHGLFQNYVGDASELDSASNLANEIFTELIQVGNLRIHKYSCSTKTKETLNLCFDYSEKTSNQRITCSIGYVPTSDESFYENN